MDNSNTASNITLSGLVRLTSWTAASRIREQIVPFVNEFRRRQSVSGCIDDPNESDLLLIGKIRRVVVSMFEELGRRDQAMAFADDVDCWTSRGLSERPYFDASRDAFRRVDDGECALFVGVTRATNSTTPTGVRLELFFVQRHQPQLLAAVEAEYAHEHDVHMDVILLAGSEGFAVGNCLVFFPESVATLDPIDRQRYAVFFFSKFFEIHGSIAAVNASRLLAPGQDLFSSTALDRYVSFQVRSLWGYLHDRAHFSGPWSMADNAMLKMHWFIGVLEEIKVDVKLILMARDGDVPYFNELFAMIMLERIFRYPLEPQPERNFDAGTGFLLFSYLLEHDAAHLECGLIRIDKERAVNALDLLVREIEDLEHRSLTPDEYRANAMQMVRRYLRETDVPKDKFTLSQDQLALRACADEFNARPPIDFSRLASS